MVEIKTNIVSGLKFVGMNINCIIVKKLELLILLDFHPPHVVAIQEANIDRSIAPGHLPIQYMQRRQYRHGGGEMLQGYLIYCSVCPSRNWKTTRSQFGLFKYLQTKLLTTWQVVSATWWKQLDHIKKQHKSKPKHPSIRVTGTCWFTRQT